MNDRITIDFETRSHCDLKKSGAWRYSIDPSTEILCLSYRFPNHEGGLWVPSISSQVPEDLLCALDEIPFVEAHNSFFELCIWENVGKRYGLPPIERNRWICSAAKASALSLPRDLEGLSKALRLPVEKDMEGRRLMLKMSKPRKITKTNSDLWHEEPHDLIRLAQYCETDTETEENASLNMRDLSASEREMFLLDQTINLRGLYVDIPLIKTALNFIDRYSVELTDRLRSVSGGEIQTAGQRDKTLTFLREKCGLELPNLQAATVSEMLEEGDLNHTARAILEIRQALSKSSTKKLEKFIDMADGKDNRIRGTLLYHGASTGRWSGKGIQPQNFPRGVIKDVDDCIETMSSGDFELFRILYPDVLGAISSCLRGMICAPPGKDLIAADFSSIESRVLFWLADEKSGLNIYKTHGKVYEDMAAFIYNKSINEIGKDSIERQLGKAAILGCGYQMGKKKFFETCLSWGIPVTQGQAAMGVDGFRTRFQKVVKFWYALNNAALAAVKNPGQVFEVGLIKYKVGGGYLNCRLPSGRLIAYRDPEIRQTETAFGLKDQVAFMAMNSQTRKWERQRTYGGKLAENVVQAVARDFMAEAMVRVEGAGYNIITTVHDEILCEIPDDFGSVEEFENLMAMSPSWGKECPIAVEGWRGKRFKK